MARVAWLATPFRVYSMALLCALGASCTSDQPAAPQPGPSVVIEFPTSSTYDRNDDGLVDIEIGLRDAGGGVDVASLEVTASEPAGPAHTGSSDLLQVFETLQRTARRLELAETTDALLPDGPVTIVVRVADLEGRVTEARVTVELPAGAFHRRLEHGTKFPFPPSFLAFSSIEILDDGSVAYLLTEHGIVPFDPWTLEVLPAIPIEIANPIAGVYDPVTDRMFIGGLSSLELAVVDPRRAVLEGTVRISGRITDLVRGPSGLLYVSLLRRPGGISVVDPVARREIRVIETTFFDALNNGETGLTPVGIPDEEDRLYVGGELPGGVWVLNPLTGAGLDLIDISPDPGLLGWPGDLMIDRGRRRVYVTQFSPLNPALVEIDIDRNEVMHYLPTEGRSRSISSSPSGSRLFVTQSRAIDRVGVNYLVDVETFTVLERFQESVTSRSGDLGSAFRPDGQLIFVASGGIGIGDDGIDVYLNRE